jgi:hypothetical protein
MKRENIKLILVPEATKVVNDHFQGGQRKAPNILDV